MRSIRADEPSERDCVAQCFAAKPQLLQAELAGERSFGVALFVLLLITENAVVWPTRPERKHLIVPIHASMMLHPYMLTLPSGIYMPYYHLLENRFENIASRK